MNDWIIVCCQFFHFEEDGRNSLAINGAQYRSGELKDDIIAITEYEPLLNQLGNVFVSTVKNSSYFFKLTNFTLKDQFSSTNQTHDLLNNFFSFLWFVKDCSCNTTVTYSYLYHLDTSIVLYPPIVYCKSDGSIDEVVFNNSEIESAFSIMEKHGQLTNDTPEMTFPSVNQGGNLHIIYKVKYKELNRIDRALRFLKEARQNNILSIKISFYVLTLECLFAANDSGELKHKLSERIAIYVGKTETERMELYNDFGRYYNIRSAYMHGGSGTSESELALTNMAIKLDNLLRRVLTKVIMQDSEEFLKTPDEQKKWFTAQLFGVNKDMTR